MAQANARRFVVGSGQLTNVDLFAGFNVLLLAVMAGLVFFRRFIDYRGAANLHEFFLYALMLSAGSLVLWGLLRRTPTPTWLLLLLQVGILLHYAGGFVQFGQSRLYDLTFLGVRYDKLVHCFNSFAVALLIDNLFTARSAELGRLRNATILLSVLGLGAVLEIVEYAVMKTVPGAGVGLYDNNLQDLLANLGGGLIFVAQKVLVSRNARARDQSQ